MLYQAKTGVLKVMDQEFDIGKNIDTFSIIYDFGVFEMTADYGIIYLVFDTESRRKNRNVMIHSNVFEDVKVYQII
jgi:hypothetical protein